MTRSTRTIRADIPADVWDRLATEALRKGIPLGRLLRNLIEARDAKMHGAVSGNTEEN